MAKCKICGKEFTPCRTNTPLNWRRVACCIEHGAMWFEKVEAARAAEPEVNPADNVELQELLIVDEPAEVAGEEESTIVDDTLGAETSCGITADEELEAANTLKGRKHR